MSDDIDIQRLEKYNKMLQGYGGYSPSKSQRGELLRKYKEYDKELEGKSYEELLDYYKEVYKDTSDYKLWGPDHAEQRFKRLEQKKVEKEFADNLSSVRTDGEIIDTYEELKVEVRELMRVRDMERAVEQNKKYDEELADSGKDTYKELADWYKDLYTYLNDDKFTTQRDVDRWSKRTDLKKDKDLDTYQELKAAVRDLMAERDKRQELRERYDDDFREEGLDTYEELAESYKRTWKLVHKGTPEENALEGKDLKDFKHLDTYQELRRQTMRLWEQHDNLPHRPVRIEKVEEVKPGASSATEGVGPGGNYGWPELEGDASRLIGGGGASPTEHLRDKAFFSGKEEGKGAPDAAAAAPAAAAEGVEHIEMPPDYVGRAGAEVAAQEPNNAPDPWGDAAKPGSSEGLGQEQPSGEGPTAAPTDQGGSPFFGVDEAEPPAGDVEHIEVPPKSAREQADAEAAEGVEHIEMPPDYAGQAGADAGGGETEVPPDPAETETPPEDHFDEVL